MTTTVDSIDSNTNLDEKFQKWLEKIRNRYNATDQKIVDDCIGEIKEREETYEELKKLLVKLSDLPPNDARQGLQSIMAKNPRTQHTQIIPKISDFIKSENSLELIKHLITGPFDTPSIGNRIEEFINKAFHRRSKKKSFPKDVAALFASEILTAIDPDNFVTFRAKWWNDFAEELKIPATFSTKEYAKSMIYAADFVKKLSETETYRRLWNKDDYPYPNYVIPAILWRNIWWPKEGIGKKEKKTQRQVEGEEKHLREIGAFAEKIVVSEERKKLKESELNEEAKKVRRISEENAKAGYDIESFGKEGEGRGKPIFIEVKGSEGFKEDFFWTENEVKVAEEKGERYWIYLVRGINLRKKTWHPEIKKYENAISIMEDPDFEMKPVKYHIVKKSR